jgi:bacterioferritin-associated ferredoxin
VTEAQVQQHADNGACTPRQIASACKAGTDCGSCVRRIQAILGRGACPRPAHQGASVLSGLADVEALADAQALGEADVLDEAA